MPEVIFLIEDAPEGGFTARALGVSICPQAETMDELRAMVREAVACHFESADAPRVIRLHYVRDEVLTP
jgi:predicted RNase H-like HicB family nuclease